MPRLSKESSTVYIAFPQARLVYYKAYTLFSRVQQVEQPVQADVFGEIYIESVAWHTESLSQATEKVDYTD